MKLIDYLKVPYCLEAESVETSPGKWVSRVSYPELPDCLVEASTIEAAVDALELQRIQIIVAMLQSGRRPPTPRSPLASSEPGWLIEKFGLQSDLGPLLEREDSELAENAGAVSVMSGAARHTANS